MDELLVRNINPAYVGLTIRVASIEGVLESSAYYEEDHMYRLIISGKVVRVGGGATVELLTNVI